MEHSVPPEILYAACFYRAGTKNTMRSHLKSIVDSVISITRLEKASVMDIGCNDGTLLGFYPSSFDKYGCDPSDIAREVKHATVVQDIFPSAEFDKILDGKKLDIITSIAMFYDLENPIDFVKSVIDLLSPNGVWIV